jgi:hypothetical protein
MTTTDNAPVIFTDPKRMTNDEIVTIIRDHAGVNPPENATREKLLEIAQEQGLRVDGETKAAKAAKAKSVEGKKPRTYLIEIPSSKYHREITGGVNGKSFRIQCDKKVEVSPAIMEALRNAKNIAIEQVKNEIGQVVDMKLRETPSVPVYVHEALY